MSETEQRLREVIRGVEADDVGRARRFLGDSDVRGRIDDPNGPFDSPASITNRRRPSTCSGTGTRSREIRRFNPPLEAIDGDFKGTPLGWTIYGSENGWYASTGKHAETVEVLVKAGARRPADISGSAAVRAVLQRTT